MVRRRNHRGIQQAHPHQKRDRYDLRAGAENEFTPRSSRLREEREERLLGSRITHSSFCSSPSSKHVMGVESFSARLQRGGPGRLQRSIQLQSTTKICTAKAISPATWRSIRLIFQLLTTAWPTTGTGQARKSKKLHPERVFYFYFQHFSPCLRKIGQAPQRNPRPIENLQSSACNHRATHDLAGTSD